MRRIMLVALLAVLIGCGGGGGGGGLSQDLAATQAAWHIIDLETGAVQSAAAVPGLTSDPTLRDRYLVVRRLPARTSAHGQAAGTWAAQPDEVPATRDHAPTYIAAFELTRAQWRRLAGDEPWTLVQPAALAGSGGDDLPACGISHARALAVLHATRLRGLDLRLPDDATWESAARAGAALFPWGDARDAATVTARAVVAETAGAELGPRLVGGRIAAAHGLHDLVGNVAEWTQEGNLRGGSWNDPLSISRPANVVVAETDLAYAQAGVRVIYRPANR